MSPNLTKCLKKILRVTKIKLNYQKTTPMGKNKYKNLKKDENGKWCYVEPITPSIIRRRIKEHIEACSPTYDPILGDCYDTSKSPYWKRKNNFL